MDKNNGGNANDIEVEKGKTEDKAPVAQESGGGMDSPSTDMDGGKADAPASEDTDKVDTGGDSNSHDDTDVPEDADGQEPDAPQSKSAEQEELPPDNEGDDDQAAENDGLENAQILVVQPTDIKAKTEAPLEDAQPEIPLADKTEETPAVDVDADAVPEKAAEIEQAENTEQAKSAQADDEQAAETEAEKTQPESELDEDVPTIDVYAEDLQAIDAQATGVEADDIPHVDSQVDGIEAEEIQPDAQDVGAEAEEIQAEDTQKAGIEAEVVPSEEAQDAVIEAEDIKSEGAQAESIEAQEIEVEDTQAAIIEAEEAQTEDEQAGLQEVESAEGEAAAKDAEAEDIGDEVVPVAEVEQVESVPVEDEEAESLSAEDAEAASLQAEDVEAASLQEEDAEAASLPAEDAETAGLQAIDAETASLPAEDVSLQAEGAEAAGLQAVDAETASLPAEDIILQTEDVLPEGAYVEGAAAEAIPSEDEQAIAQTLKPEYSLMGFGLICITSELVWFYGSRWVITALRSLGMNPVAAQYMVAVLWFPLTMFIIPYFYMRAKGLDPEKFVGMGGKFKLIDVTAVALAAFAVWALMRMPEQYWARFVEAIFRGKIPRISGIGAYDTIFIIDFIRKCMVPAFFEEYLYRGVLYRSLRGGIGAKRAAVLSSIIFMLMHTDLTNVVAPIALGLLCAYLLEVTGSLYPCMLSHFIYNTSSTIGNLGVAAREVGLGDGGIGATMQLTILMLVSCSILLSMCLYMVKKSGRYEGSVSVEEYAVCKRSRLDLLPYYCVCIMLVAGYFTRRW